MTHPTGWPTAQRICDIPEVREALDAFAEDAHEENMLAMASAIMGHANDIASSENEEQSSLVDKLQEALAFWLPSMPMRMGMEEMASRIEHDSWLLVGASGELSPGAEEAGWIVKVEPDASPASVRAAALPATISEADAKRLYDQAYHDHTDEPMALTFAKLVLEHAALSAAPAGGLGEVEPICYIKYFTAQQWSGNGNHDIQIYEGYQVCDEGDDGAIPVAPIAAAQGEGK